VVEGHEATGWHKYVGSASVLGGVTVSGTSLNALALLLFDQPVKFVPEAAEAVEPTTFADQLPMKKLKLLLDDTIELTATVILGLSGLRTPTKPLSWNVT
jgi:hypothetical protein